MASKISPPQMRLRARIVLLAGGGARNDKIGKDLRITTVTVGKWRGRFANLRLAGLEDALRSGRPRTLEGQMERSLVRAEQQLGKDMSRVSCRQAAINYEISKSAVQETWARHGRLRTLHAQHGVKLLVPKQRWGDLVGLHLSGRFWLAVTNCSDAAWVWEGGCGHVTQDEAMLYWRLVACADLLSQRLSSQRLSSLPPNVFLRNVFDSLKRVNLFGERERRFFWHVLLLGGTKAMAADFARQAKQHAHLRCYHRPRHVPRAEELHAFLTAQRAACQSAESCNSVGGAENWLALRLAQGGSWPDVLSWSSNLKGTPTIEPDTSEPF